MRVLACAAAVLLLSVGGEAKASSFAWCQMSGGNYEGYLSGIVEIGDGGEAFRTFVSGQFGKGFTDYVRDAFDPGASNLVCSREDSLFFANDHIEVIINANPGIKYVQTGWRGAKGVAAKDDRPKAVSKSKATAAAPGTVKSKTVATASAAKTVVAELTETSAGKPTVSDSPPQKPWDIEYDRKMAVYAEELARQQQAVADYERGKAETAAMKAELQAKAEKAQADWKKAVAACRAGNHSACRAQ